MNGVHDMGGMHGFGPVVVDAEEPAFHSRWEGKVRAMMERTNGSYYHLDEFRHAIERMPAAAYLRAGYYEKWLHAVESLLLEKGVITRQELDAQRALQPAPAPAPPRAAPPPLKARFQPGDRVRTLNRHPSGHTRLPRYARAKAGTVRTVNGPFLLPDTNAHQRGPDWEACYAVEFAATELWGDDAVPSDRVCVDLWESYLLPDGG